ncbi:MAG: TraR/DksA C4-type zinc finger protein, partial [Acidimicrobiales bacterium]
AKTVRSAKATGTVKAGSRAVTTKSTPATTSKAVKSSAKSAAKPVGARAKKAEKTPKPAGAAKAVEHAKPHAKPHASSTTKVAPAKKAAASVNSTTKSNSTSAASPAKKAATAGPYAKEPKFLEEQHALLLEERGIYQGQAEDLQAEADSLAQEREPGDVQFDEESGEGGTVTVDRERDLALSAQALLAVEEIDDARRKIDRKTYGACERCHEAIPKARLRALPFARLCVACKSGGLSRR